MLVYVHLLVFACSLPDGRGPGWVLQRWPEDILGGAFVFAVFSLPVVPLIAGVYLTWKTLFPLLISLPATSWVLIALLPGLDMTADAQSGIAFCFIQGVAMVAGLGALVLGLVIHFVIPKNWPSARARTRRKSAGDGV